jgi:hypothetical protein
MKSDPFYAFVGVVNKLGRTPKGFDRKGRRADVIFKAIFKATKSTVTEIWEIYTQHRDELSRKLVNNKETVVAYLLGFHLANMARAKTLFDRSNQRHQWKKKISGKKIRVYDIGCGTGAMSLALDIEAEYIFIDGSGPLLDAAAMLAQASGLSIRTSRRVIEDLDPKQFTSRPGEESVHVYLLGYVWNELGRNLPARRKLLTIITKHLERGEHCLVFVAEPALEFMARPAMELRDALCDAGFSALYPCSHSEPCPMLSRPKDWCYSEGEWDQPPLAQWIDEQLGMNRAKIAGTMLAFASPEFKCAATNLPVVVGRPVRDEGKERYKGFFDYLVCDERGISKVSPQSPKQVAARGTILKEIANQTPKKS